MKRIGISTLLLLCSCVFVLLLSACAPDTGILASGGNWQVSGLQKHHIRTLAVDPNNPQKLYAGDEQGNVFFSSDAALHWTERSTGLPLPVQLNALALDIPGKKLYAATDKGLFVSANEGQQWSAVALSAVPAGTSTTALAFDASVNNVVYVGTANQGVLMSTDQGSTWAKLESGLPQASSINALIVNGAPPQLWAGTSSGVYRSDDNGKSWRAFNTGLPDGLNIYAVQPASASGGAEGVVYLGTNKGFFVSTDNGQHWGRGKISLENISVRCIVIDFRSTNSANFFVCTDVAALRSTDQGQTWGGIGSGLPKNQPVYALALGAKDYAQLFAASDDVYMYPGSSGGLDAPRLITIVLLLSFFYLLFRITQRKGSRRKVRRQANPPQPDEQVAAPVNSHNGSSDASAVRKDPPGPPKTPETPTS